MRECGTFFEKKKGVYMPMDLTNEKFLTFEDIIFTYKILASSGLYISSAVDLEVGAGTFHPATLLKSLGKKNGIVLIQQCRRPTDGRYGENLIECNNIFNFKFY